MNYHSFPESLKRSHEAEDLPIWKEVYKKAFLNMIEMINHRQDGEHQRAGIDRSIILANSKQILIDEKVRFKNEKTGRVYKDILLEYWSDFERRIPGWICKPLRADYIAYAIAPLGKCYLLPVIQLQKAWETYGEIWLIKYGPPKKAKNKDDNNDMTWTTIRIAIPVKVLFQAIGNCLRINFTPFKLPFKKHETSWLLQR